jgi:hypothetical protein
LAAILAGLECTNVVVEDGFRWIPCITFLVRDDREVYLPQLIAGTASARSRSPSHGTRRRSSSRIGFILVQLDKIHLFTSTPVKEYEGEVVGHGVPVVVGMLDLCLPWDRLSIRCPKIVTIDDDVE